MVVGYGTQKRKDLTGAVGSVDGKDIREYLAVSRVDQALLGKAGGCRSNRYQGNPEQHLRLE